MIDGRSSDSVRKRRRWDYDFKSRIRCNDLANAGAVHVLCFPPDSILLHGQRIRRIFRCESPRCGWERELLCEDQEIRGSQITPCSGYCALEQKNEFDEGSFFSQSGLLQSFLLPEEKMPKPFGLSEFEICLGQSLKARFAMGVLIKKFYVRF